MLARLRNDTHLRRKFTCFLCSIIKLVTALVRTAVIKSRCSGWSGRSVRSIALVRMLESCCGVEMWPSEFSMRILSMVAVNVQRRVSSIGVSRRGDGGRGGRGSENSSPT